MPSPLAAISPIACPRTVAEARDALRPCVGLPFGLLFPRGVLDYLGGRNKGAGGLAIEGLLSVRPSRSHLDLPPFDGYAGGEIKAVSTDAQGVPAESVCLCSLGTRQIDETLAGVPFGMSYVGGKVREFLMVGYCRQGNPDSWHVTFVRAFLEDDPAYAEDYARMALEYREIGDELAWQVDRSGLILRGTTSRGRLLQVRTKGAGHGRGRVWSDLLGGYATDRGRALFLTKPGLRGLLAA